MIITSKQAVAIGQLANSLYKFKPFPQQNKHISQTMHREC